MPRDMLREQTTALLEGQASTDHMLDELRDTRSGPLDTTEFNNRLWAIEVLLHQLIDRRVGTERPVHIQPPSESISDVGTVVDAEDFQQGWQDWTRLPRDRVPLAATQPNLDHELLALLQAPPPQVPIGVQPLPAVIPFAYQRSTSPILWPATSQTATEPMLFSPEIQHPIITRPTPGCRGSRGLCDRPVTEAEAGASGALRPPPGVFSDPRPPPLPINIPPVPINVHGRPSSAPANLEPNDEIREPQTWYRPPRSQDSGMPPPPVIPGQQGGRQYVPMPPGPTVVQSPLSDTLMNILREHRLAQLAAVDQQQELMRYMRGLNEWLERDMQDRQTELRGVTARVDELRKDFARLGSGMQPGVQPPGVHPSHGAIPVGPIPSPPIFGPGPPGFVPQEVPEPSVVPARSPTRQEFSVPPSGGGPVVILPGSVGHVGGPRSRSRSLSPRRGYGDRYRYPPYDNPYYRRCRHPYSPDYDYPRHRDDRRRQYYSPGYGPHCRHYDDYSPRRRGPRDCYSRSSSPRGGERRRDDDPQLCRRHPDSSSPTRSEERDPSRRAGRSLTHRASTHTSYDEGDHPRTHRTPSRPSYDECDHPPIHRTPTVYSEEDVPGSSHSRDIPASPRSPTVIRIRQPERTHPESLIGRCMIVDPGERPFSPVRKPSSELRHQLQESYIPTVPSLHPIPSVRDGGRRPHSPAPPATEHDDGRLPRRSPSIIDDDRRHRSPSARDDEADPYGSRAASQVPSRTGSQTGGMPAAIQRDDGSRQESEMVPIPSPAGHGHLPDHDPRVHLDPKTTRFDEAFNWWHDRLDEIERKLNQVIQSAHEAEDRREADFQDGEEHRQQIFLQNEQRRDDEARQHGDKLFARLEDSACSVPSLPDLPSPGSVDNASIIESIHAASHEAASRHASDILETVLLEREQSARERESFASKREQERGEFAAERARMDEECERRIHDLEEELARVRGELDSERQLRQTENEERAAANERDEGMRAQLSDTI
ncbi:hypothetical protein BDR03DRAFT_1091838 [Suillus americanus]|nr:hypothetical protein BDR03DRAFT_1091838 [Suillus americanus]